MESIRNYWVYLIKSAGGDDGSSWRCYVINCMLIRFQMMVNLVIMNSFGLIAVF